ncbi:MAG: redoxin domain-containing protein [Chloracidobacterium sp.]|nr:redoxin domain-containing protein [Chloracidobacterium sp.]
MKRAILFFTAMMVFAVAANAQSIAIGGTMENFSLPDGTGKMQTLDSLKGKNGAVIMFVSSQCPVVKLYNERMNEIAADYAAKGITFIGINSNVTEIEKAEAKPVGWVKDHIAATYKFTVLFDKGNVFADKLGATTTPEAFFVNGSNVLMYHGAIDNDKSGANITTPYLRTAFDSALAGKRIERTSANAFGCTIKRVE